MFEKPEFGEKFEDPCNKDPPSFFDSGQIDTPDNPQLSKPLADDTARVCP